MNVIINPNGTATKFLFARRKCSFASQELSIRVLQHLIDEEHWQRRAAEIGICGFPKMDVPKMDGL